MAHRRTKKTHRMTKEESFDAIAAMRDTWATDSNATSDQTRLFELGEAAIEQLDKLLTTGGGHPQPPPPRIRP